MKKVIEFIRNKRDASFKKRLERVMNTSILDTNIRVHGEIKASKEIGAYVKDEQMFLKSTHPVFQWGRSSNGDVTELEK